jgi:hypothetical protein
VRRMPGGHLRGGRLHVPNVRSRWGRRGGRPWLHLRERQPVQSNLGRAVLRAERRERVDVRPKQDLHHELHVHCAGEQRLLLRPVKWPRLLLGLSPALGLACAAIVGFPDVPNVANESTDAGGDRSAGEDARDEVVSSSDAGDALGRDAAGPSESVTCGPALSCSIAVPGAGCCVTFSDSGEAPFNYDYACAGKARCLEAGGAGLIACDISTQCPNPSDVCCWPGEQVPRVTYCETVEAGDCAHELCNPDAAMPCIYHPTYHCVPTGPDSPLPLAPLGYSICVPDAG